MIIGNQQQRSTESPENQQSLCPDNRAPRDEVTDRRGHKSNTEKITKNSQKNAGQRKKKVLPFWETPKKEVLTSLFIRSVSQTSIN